jgi:hypothetical protein
MTVYMVSLQAAELLYANAIRQAGLDKVIQAYQQRQLSQADALNIIRAANTYATTQFAHPLYPPVQQRQFIGQVFGFSYAIDSSVPQVGFKSSGSQILF